MAARLNALPQELKIMILARIPYNPYDYGNVRCVNRDLYMAFHSPDLPTKVFEAQYDAFRKVQKVPQEGEGEQQVVCWGDILHTWNKVHSQDGLVVRGGSQAPQDVQLTAMALLYAVCTACRNSMNNGLRPEQRLQRATLALSKMIRLVLPRSALLLLRYSTDMIYASLRRHHDRNLLFTSILNTQSEIEARANTYCFHTTFENNLLALYGYITERFADLNTAQAGFGGFERKAKELRRNLEQHSHQQRTEWQTRLLQLTMNQAVKASLVARQDDVPEDISAEVDNEQQTTEVALPMNNASQPRNSVEDLRARMAGQFADRERDSGKIRILFEDRAKALEKIWQIDVREIFLDVLDVAISVRDMTDDEVLQAIEE